MIPRNVVLGLLLLASPELPSDQKTAAKLCFLMGTGAVTCSSGYEQTKRGLMLCIGSDDESAAKLAKHICKNAVRAGWRENMD